MNSLDITKYLFFTKLTNLPFVHEIWLYGSRARQDNQNRSDIDLAILSPNASAKDWHTVLDIIDRADTLLKIDTIQFDKLDNDSAFKKNILKDHVVLYSRKSK